MPQLIDFVPQHLLEELVEGTWLPIVGAGFSRNAVIQGGDPPASWSMLGKALGHEVDGADADGDTLDMISSFDHAFGRVALIDRTTTLIRAHDAKPGAAHLAFAKTPFTYVLTTNFDLLLERAYEQIGKGCLPVVDESQLSVPNRFSGPRLIKFHGDINHPSRMVITEEDYDQFLHAYPLLVTSVTSLLIERTGVLIGYSLDDPDTRHILALIKRRLGRMYRPLWTIQVNASNRVVNRYERRGVKVINLPDVDGIGPGQQLERFFAELAQYWRDHLPEKSISTDDRVTADFIAPESPSRICYFAIPAELIGWYRDFVFHDVEAMGLVPVTARDVLTPPGTVTAKLEALIGRAALVVAEIGHRTSEYEALTAISQKPESSVLLVAPEGNMVRGLNNFGKSVLIRPDSFDASSEEFAWQFKRWLSMAVEALGAVGNLEPERLIANGDSNTALVSAVSLLEATLSRALADSEGDSLRSSSLRFMLRLAGDRELFESLDEQHAIENAVNWRNQIMHGKAKIGQAESDMLVAVIRRFVDRINVGLVSPHS